MTRSAETRAAFERHATYVNPEWVRVLEILGYGRSFVRAEGTRMWDAEGRAYVDFLAGCGSVPLGYNHPAILEAAEACLRAKPPSFVQLAPPVGAGLLAEALAARLHPSLSRCHLTSSGSEAIDGALKLAFAATRRSGVLYCDRGYHGVSLGALSIMGSARMRERFPSLPGAEMIPFGDADRARELLASERFAALVVEPIQFEGGVRTAPPAYFQEIAAACRRHGTLLVFDEAQTGMGRTGTLFAHEWLGVVPDVLCYAKALSGGLVPIGGYSTTPEHQRRAYGRMQDCELVANTYGGGALACAVALRTLSLVDDALLARVRAAGERLERRLRAVGAARSLLADVRGRGLMWALELATPTEGLAETLTLGIPNKIARELYAFWVAQRMLERGWLTQVPAHDTNVLRVEPPLVVEDGEIDGFAAALDATLEENDGFAAMLAGATGRLLARALGQDDS